MKEKILLTGGTGYIGSHTAVELIDAGYDVVIADNLSNSSKDVLSALKTITGCDIPFHEIDVADNTSLNKIFEENKISAVIHFAGFKAVSESVKLPLKYYRNNLDSTLTLLETMQEHNCNRIIFSSSATVYGENKDGHLFNEKDEVGKCSNPYGRTKYMIEEILNDVAFANPELSIVLLRYFNPIGAHSSALIGEKPNGIPNNLMPYITQVAAGIREKLNIFGNDYDTPDGTCIRDYIHVVDLAKGHVAALRYTEQNLGSNVFNLGTGKGSSVLDVVKAFEKANNLTLPYVFAPRREGDVPVCVADPTKANTELQWKAEKNLLDMCRDSWNWQKNSSL